jgi:hypothetical protein
VTLEELNEMICKAPANSMLNTHVVLSAVDAGRASACLEHYAKDVARYRKLCEVADVSLTAYGLTLSGPRESKYSKLILDVILDAIIDHEAKTK